MAQVLHESAVSLRGIGPVMDDDPENDEVEVELAGDGAVELPVESGEPTLLPSPTPRPHWDPWQPTWLRPLIRLFMLDEHGPMPRTVAAQVGFAAVLMLLQTAVDILAWTLGLRWVFVSALGSGGWALTILFATLISVIILIFERFVVTAAVPLNKSPFSNKGTLIRVGVVLAFAMVTAIPVEMMIFHDVIQGQIGGEIEARRAGARTELLAEVDKNAKVIAAEELTSRQSVKLELPEIVKEKVDTSDLDAQVLSEKADLPRLEREAKRSDARAAASERRAARAKYRADNAGDTTAARRSSLERAASEAKTRASWLRGHATADAAALEGQQRGIVALETERTRRQDTVDAANESVRKEAMAEHQATLTTISDRSEERRKLLDARRVAIDKMDDKALALATKRSFSPPDGFARRWKLMNELEDGDPLFALTKWAVRVLFVGLSMLVLASKSFFHRRTRAYYLGFDPMDRRIGSL
jgi:hypothetical protein